MDWTLQETILRVKWRLEKKQLRRDSRPRKKCHKNKGFWPHGVDAQTLRQFPRRALAPLTDLPANRCAVKRRDAAFTAAAKLRTAGKWELKNASTIQLVDR
jgi:hypothetical protein